MKDSIIRHVNRGDRKAFGEVFDHYFNALAAFAHKYTADIEISEDLVQEVFIAFWEKRKDFENLPAVKSFLYTSVRNKCLNHLKHEKVKMKHESSLIYELESERAFSGQVIQEEVFNQLYTEIKALPDASREIMLLVLNGLKNQDIADELGVSINTVKTQKKIAYAKIKDRMGSSFNQAMLFFLLIRIFF